jgi:hypothetical protein
MLGRTAGWLRIADWKDSEKEVDVLFYVRDDWGKQRKYLFMLSGVQSKIRKQDKAQTKQESFPLDCD